MIERNPTLDWITHLVLILGSLLAILPLWFVFVAATLSIQEINAPHLNLLPGEHFFENLTAACVHSGRFWKNSVCIFDRICNRFLPIPGTANRLLDDFHHADAAP